MELDEFGSRCSLNRNRRGGANSVERTSFGGIERLCRGPWDAISSFMSLHSLSFEVK